MNRKKLAWMFIIILLLFTSALAYLMSMESKGQYFKCDTEVYFENVASHSKIEGDVSLMLVSDNIGMLYVRGCSATKG
ncbi:Uncharacterised protein [Serratia fonticola]|uniref:Uncharacterized protein n=1 Tax=Serratia fonticola TaxID=47917 RepID=A0A448SKV3_SERFO|nr:Uncharacterised protein [Serratia fonticola]